MTKLTLYHGDALEILPNLPDESVDAVITDPPYNIAKGSSRIGDTRTRKKRIIGESMKTNNNTLLNFTILGILNFLLGILVYLSLKSVSISENRQSGLNCLFLIFILMILVVIFILIDKGINGDNLKNNKKQNKVRGSK